MMNYHEIMNYLDALEPKFYKLKASELNQEGIKQLLNKFGQPEKYLHVIHVAGTKGKGSVCAFLSYILAEAGYRVGLYISPHLYDFRERIQINNVPISKQDVARLFNKIQPFVTNQTYFEIVTAMAFLYFMEKSVDFVVLEVGMGGRLDTTNIVTPLVSVITNISLEHTEYLGHTLENIAFEKAGIIKNNRPTVTMADGGALKVIQRICHERNSKLFIVKEKDANALIRRKVKLGMAGNFQYKNAAVALNVLDVLKERYGINIKESTIKKGMAKACWPGRFEFISRNVLVDGAHTVNSAMLLRTELERLKKENKFRNFIFIVGFSSDKDVSGIMKALEPLARLTILTKSRHFRALEPEKIRRYVKKDFRIIKDVKKALGQAKKIASKEDLIVVTGSLYVIGELGGLIKTNQ